jgi:Ala-tRNA(Pro) deacylase
MLDPEALYRFLKRSRIQFSRHDHPMVHTVAEVHRLTPNLPGAKTKNLFLCDDRGKTHFLVTVPDVKCVDLKALAEALGVKKLRFASARRLARHLGLEPGAVTLLGVVNDDAHLVRVVIDETLWQAEAVQCHPLVNTSTLVLPLADLRRFFEATGHSPTVMPVPQRSDNAS